MFRLFCTIGMLFMLMGCSNTGPEANVSRALFTSLKTAAGKMMGVPEAAPEKLVFERASLEAIPERVLLLYLPHGDVTASVVQFVQNGDVETYMSADGITISTRKGMIVATRGLGDDLMQAQMDPIFAAFARKGGRYMRSLSYLDGLDHMSPIHLHCDLKRAGSESIDVLGKTYTAQRFEEDCTSDQISFQNIYWRVADQMIQSEQWVSFAAGRVRVQQIK